MQSASTMIAANLAVTAVMALAVAVGGCFGPIRRQPRLRHALWLLIVAKLITLPVVELPLLPPDSFEVGDSAPRADLTASGETNETPGFRCESATGATAAVPQVAGPVHHRADATGQVQDSTTLAALRSEREPPCGRIWWLAVCGIIAVPTVLVTVTGLGQMRRVSRLIDHTAPADERLSRIAAAASRRMGLDILPEVRIVGGRLTPLLWMRRGRPLVVLPAGLVGRLGDDQVECIICHELAHFIRRDHWANGFAFCVSAMYWWYPVVWWARRELLAAQEQCCDALVISRTQMARRRYAETLLQTIEFMNDERPLLPVLASGFGRVSALQRRFEMIANKRVHNRIPILAVGLVLVLAVAFFCLPVRGQAVRTTDGGTAASEAAESVFVAEPRGPGSAKLYPPKAAARGGLAASSVPVVEKVVLDYRVADVTVDPRKHCMYLCQPPGSGQGALRIELERGVTYTVSAAGEAFMSAQTGNNADPFPGIILYYGTGEEDGYAIRYAVLKPGDSLTFKTPWLISPDDEVFALAFFVSAWPHGEQRGSYKLTFTRAPGAQADVNAVKFLDIGRGVIFEAFQGNLGNGVFLESFDPATTNAPKP